MTVWQILSQFYELLKQLAVLLGDVLLLGLHWWLLLFWVAWWLRGVNWKKAWPVLAQGGWVPLALLVALGALVWSQVAPPDSYRAFGLDRKPGFWWHLAGAGLLAGSALFCGWLQGVLGWTPPEISVDPPAHAEHGHDHHGGHGHGHH